MLGANGAGKTTLMRMICGVLKQSSGEILFNNEYINKLGEDYFDGLGMLPQDFGYYPDFSEEVFLFYMSTVKGLDKPKAKNKPFIRSCLNGHFTAIQKIYIGKANVVINC